MPRFAGFDEHGWPKYEETVDDKMVQSIREEEQGVADYAAILAKFPSDMKLKEVIDVIVADEKKHIEMLKKLLAKPEEKTE